MDHDASSSRPNSGRNCSSRSQTSDKQEDTMDDSGEQYDPIPPKEWMDRTNQFGGKASIETIKEWLKHPRIKEFIDWKDEEGDFGATMLIRNALDRRWDIVRVLVEGGADVNATTTRRQSALMVASYMGNTEIVDFLLTKGANVHIESVDRRETAMIGACRFGHTDIVKLLAEKGGADLNYTEKKGNTVLNIACFHAQIDTARVLIDLGADVNIPDKKGVSPLMNVLINHLLEIAKKKQDEESAEFQKGFLQIAKYLVDRGGADINAQNSHGRTALHRACNHKEQLETAIQFLVVEHGANVNLRDYIGGWTPLHIACNHKHMEAIQILVEHGADVHAKEKHVQVEFDHYYGRTSLHMACEQKHMEAIQFLVQHGANLNDQDSDGSTPLHSACKQNHFEAIRFLVKQGADLEIKDNRGGRTPLHRACELNNEGIEVAKLLLRLGSNPNAKTTAGGKTALQVAASSRQCELVWYLVRQYPRLVLLEQIEQED